MVGPGADCPTRNTAEEVADYTLRMLNSRVPPATAGIMFLSGGLSELDSTLYLNAMNQSPNPWHVSPTGRPTRVPWRCAACSCT